MGLSEDAARALSECGDLLEKTYENDVLEGVRGKLLEMNGCRLHRCTLLGCDVSRMAFVETEFRQCDLSNLSLRGATFQKCRFLNCRMTGFQVDEGACLSSEFADCALNYAGFARSHMQNVTFRDCRMDSVSLRGLKWKGMVLDGCSLQNAEVQGAPFAGIDLRSCELGGLVIQPADLRGAVVTGAQAIQLAGLLGLVVKQ